MTLDGPVLTRPFLFRFLPRGSPRIRHYGLFAGTVRARNIERVRQWLAAPEASPAETEYDFEDPNTEGPSPGRRCPCCGGPLILVATLPRPPPPPPPPPAPLRDRNPLHSWACPPPLPS